MKKLDIFYFTYGSNMDESRLKKRKINYEIIGLGILQDYRLRFNKISKRDNTTGFANIEKFDGEVVEGIIMKIDEESLFKLDKAEGYPEHYSRDIMNIKFNEFNNVNCVVYYANDNWISESVKPTKEYIRHLFAGCEYLSEKYFNKLVKMLSEYENN